MPVRCLIVDDNHDFLRAARELLERDGISVVDAVSTGSQARSRATELSPDVTLIDIDLGQENGFEVASELASYQDGRPLPMILISSYSGDDFADLIADSPALSFLAKAELSGAAIRAILAGADCPGA